MPRTLTAYVCQQCESQYPQSYGRCPGCGAWGGLQETIVSAPVAESKHSRSRAATTASMLRLTEVEPSTEARLAVPLPDLSRVLGGGIVPGSAILLGGDPGVGKSTLLLQAASLVGAGGATVLYVTGEESPPQLRMRADRLSVIPSTLSVLAETDVDSVIATAAVNPPAVIIVDSIQTMETTDLESAAGSVAQVKETASRLVRFGKQTGSAVFLVGHVTKEGNLAGPKVLEHMVDVVLYLEGDHFQAYRVLRSLKNRFGSSHEIAVYDMREDGLHEVGDLSDLFVNGHGGVSSGAAVTIAMEGTRPIPVEVQALASRTAFGLPRRSSTGIDINRLHMLTAVLAKRANIDVGTHDIYVNVVGGLRIDEPAVDLAVLLAINSSYADTDLPRCVVIGEVGLGGEIRPVGQMRRRLGEAQKIGMELALVPAGQVDTKGISLELVQVDTVADAVAKFGRGKTHGG